MSDENPTPYAEALARLQELVGKLENAEVNVDELEAVVAESVALIASCRARLRATQTSVDTLLAGLMDKTASAALSARTPALFTDDEFAD